MVRATPSTRYPVLLTSHLNKKVNPNQLPLAKASQHKRRIWPLTMIPPHDMISPQTSQGYPRRHWLYSRGSYIQFLRRTIAGNSQRRRLRRRQRKRRQLTKRHSSIESQRKEERKRTRRLRPRDRKSGRRLPVKRTRLPLTIS